MTAVQPWLPPQQVAPPHIPPPPQPGQPNPYTGFRPTLPPFSPPVPPAPRRSNRAVKWCFFASLLATVACGVAFVGGIGRMISEPFTIVGVETYGQESYATINSTAALNAASVERGPCPLVDVADGNFVFACPGVVDIDDPITVSYTTLNGERGVATSNWGRGIASMAPLIIGAFGGFSFGLATLALGIVWLTRRKPPVVSQPVYAAAPPYPPGYYR